MKILFLAVSLFLAMTGCTQNAKTDKPALKKAVVNTVPQTVLTADSTTWTWSTLSNVGYVNTTPGANYNTYQGGGGMIAKFKFKEGNKFEFSLYVKVNTYGYVNETWTQVEGTVEFTRDAKGQNVFHTKATQGIYRINKNGTWTKRSITADELKNQHSNSYLWERSDLSDDKNNTYLLMVDLKAHPEADVNDPKSIDPSWVSKFHIPKK